MTTSLTIRLDEQLKADAEELFEDIGLNLTTAITCFFKKAVDMNAIPFTLGRKTKHQKMVDAFNEAKEVSRNPNAPYCDDPSKLEEFLLS